MLQIVKNNQQVIQDALDYNRDYLFDYFGIKTLLRSYLIKINDEIIERPQQMYMRVALSITNNIEDAIETYYLMSNH